MKKLLILGSLTLCILAASCTTDRAACAKNRKNFKQKRNYYNSVQYR